MTPVLPLPPLVRKPSGFRSFWLAIAWILVGWTLWQGASYAITGNSQVHSPTLYVLANEVPFGMRTHGILMLALALLFVYHLKATSRSTKKVLRVFCGYNIAVAVSVVGSWWVTGQVVFSAPSFWLAFAAISGAMLRWPPPPKGSDDA